MTALTFQALVNNLKGTAWLIMLIAGIGGSFAISQYKISELEGDVGELKSNTKNVVILQQQMKEISTNISELKDQNRETYRLLLDISKR